MRVIITTRDAESSGWLRTVLGAAGLSVAILDEPDPKAPELDGADLLLADRECAALLEGAGPDRRLLLVGRGQPVDVPRALSEGFMDLLVIPAPEEEILARVGRALDRFLKAARPAPGPRAQADELRTIVQHVVQALKRAGRAQATHELAEGMLSVFLLMIDAHETAERGTPGHSKRVATIVRDVAQRLDYPAAKLGWLELAARLHDLGLVPLNIPLKDAAPLSAERRRALTEHPVMAAEILKPLGTWGLPVDAIRRHHERVGGHGYPSRISEVPLDAQILGAVDVFEALVSPRPWRPAETVESAIEALRTSGGFADEVIDAIASSAVAGEAGR